MTSLTRKLLQKMRVFWRLPWREKLWIVLLYPLSGIIRATILILPFYRFAPLLGRFYQNIELSTVVSPIQQRLALRISKIVNVVSKYTLWESKCLVKAALASILLNYYGIPYVLYLGVARKSENVNIGTFDTLRFNKPVCCLEAHAWVKVGQSVVTGRRGHRKFMIVSTFLSPSLISSESVMPL